MNIYRDYLDTIEKALHSEKEERMYDESMRDYQKRVKKDFTFQDFKNQVSETTLLPSLENFSQELGLQPNFNNQLGLHPDFAHLKYSKGTESHYIVSMFIDIKGSTNLFKRYTPETVMIITNTIQHAAIHTCLIFGGYIHRLHGDGLFVYFGGKTIDKETAVKKAMQSASIFTYFVKHDLKNMFNEQGIKNIYTRIGIDLGYDIDVLWAKAGIGEISEVTTCSLHTSLASKMQSNAINNGIVIGENAKTQDEDYSNYCQPVYHRTNKDTDRYIFEDTENGFRYTQYDFNWFKFLKVQPFIASDIKGNPVFKTNPNNSQKDPEELLPIASRNKPYLDRG